MTTYHELVDVHGPVRNAAIAAFRLVPQLNSLSEREILDASWEAYQALVAEILDAQDCPNCGGRGELGEPPNEILCPTCGSDGWTYGRQMTDQAHPTLAPDLPDASPGTPNLRPSRPAPLPTAALNRDGG